MNKLFTASTGTADGLLQQSTRQRYLSLDVLRGMTIALMIVVNTPGSWQNIYAPFRHAAWHGFTLTDLVFPTFLFVVGNAMSFSMRKFEQQPDSAFLRKVLTRAALIFLVGLLLNTFPFVTRNEANELVPIDFSSIRIMGVLQRIALCYLFASLVVHYLKVKGAILFSGIALFGYWAILYFFGNQPDPYSLEGNAALKFDLLVLPAKNLYQGFGLPFDPEGLLSTLPAVVNVIGGFLAGLYIQRQGNNRGTVLKLAVAGAVFAAAALVWDLYFPINKPIWTSSYVLYTIGLDLGILAVLMLVIEVAGYKGWTYFFEVFGRNPLFIYAMSGVLVRLMSLTRVEGLSLNGWMYTNAYLSWLQPNNASLLFAVSYMLLLWAIGYWMDRKRVYIKV
ncbi:heparan-alpha-glucosaminide N-acetyltransferase domain-containing protein [Pontibacter sp. E15-1]|uniref:acyltransferase family protein n=1 Tax=Pontibacter sp. E15-1 TaxID=2919918 RepID=UPI001F4FC627|nr:heparan-alpha-glucosaminide N-acetyltransferase domain-containing protein [Pontibacter sp. E15-1]MCJ8164073.1 heparan-alpha-glucosaminide N-acetyltransferase domain-containing protein [Pontibacter sp. E15-1]